MRTKSTTTTPSLCPVLRKNKKTKSLVPDALNDNKLTRKLPFQLEEMPKDSDEFTDGLAELRRTFQQHVPDLEAVRPVEALASQEVHLAAVNPGLHSRRQAIIDNLLAEANKAAHKARRVATAVVGALF